MDLPRLCAPSMLVLGLYLRQIKDLWNAHTSKPCKELGEAQAYHSLYFLPLFFTKSDAGETVFNLHSLIHSFVNHIRWTNEVGWSASRRIDILLPNKSSVGYQMLVNSVFEAGNAKISAPEHIMYTNPSASFHKGDWYSRQLSFKGLIIVKKGGAVMG